MAIDYQSTVFWIGDDPVARDAIIVLASQKGLRAEVFASGEEFLKRYHPEDRGCVFVSVRSPETGVFDFLANLKERKATLPVVVAAENADVRLAVRAMQQGAFTLFERPSTDEISTAIEQAIAADQAAYEQHHERTETEARLATLTSDELEVFRRLLAGHANKRIASDLDIGLRTVELRRSNIMKKMQATSLPDLVRMAILIDFLKPIGRSI